MSRLSHIPHEAPLVSAAAELSAERGTGVLPPVCIGAAGLDRFVSQELSSKTHFCLYVAAKTPRGWELSGSRISVHRALEAAGVDCVYLAVHIDAGDEGGLSELCVVSQQYGERLAGFNTSQPHKANGVVRQKFGGGANTEHFDAVTRDEHGRFKLRDLNGPSFVGWYEDEVGNFNGRRVVVVGGGGAGGSIARAIAHRGPAHITVVDPMPKHALVASLREIAADATVEYLDCAPEVPLPPGSIVINAAGDVAAAPDSDLDGLLRRNRQSGGTFVDIRAKRTLANVTHAQEAYGWAGHTGIGMSRENDRELHDAVVMYLGGIPLHPKVFGDIVDATACEIDRRRTLLNAG